MAKMGILHDYDLHANLEPSASNNKCVVCGKYPMIFQWSDYSGEGMCTDCGCPYQLKWGSDAQQAEGKYPYLNMADQFVAIAKEYWSEKRTFVCYGRMLGPKPGMAGLVDWLEEHYPEQLSKKD